MKYKVTLSTKQLRLYNKELVADFKTYEEAHKCFLALIDDNRNNTNGTRITLLEDYKRLLMWGSVCNE